MSETFETYTPTAEEEQIIDELVEQNSIEYVSDLDWGAPYARALVGDLEGEAWTAMLEALDFFEGDCQKIAFRSRGGVLFCVVFFFLCCVSLHSCRVQSHCQYARLRPTHPAMLATLRHRRVIPLLHPRTRYPQSRRLTSLYYTSF